MLDRNRFFVAAGNGTGGVFSPALLSRTLVKRGGSQNGQALIEFALMVPLLFVLIAGLVDFGGFIYAWITVTHTTRAVAQYAVLGGVWLNYGGGTVPNSTNLGNAVSYETTALPNSSSNVTANVCEYNNGTLATTMYGTCARTSPYTADNEPVLTGSSPVYSQVVVDVTYTYHPFIPVFNFSRLGVSLPALFSNNISVRRRTVMRMIQ